MSVQDRVDVLRREGFVGVPFEDFEHGGREQLIFLLMAGLEPKSKLIDIGCGVLRGGYWLIHFLDTGCYHGLDPHSERIRLGLEHILEASTRESKNPTFDTNPGFDLGVFGLQFDYFLAYSIWTHSSKAQIAIMLEGFLRNSRPNGVLLATISPTTWRRRDYLGDRWVGTSHESNVPGIVHHDLNWLRRECSRRDLVVRSMGRDTTHGQLWLHISRSSADVRPIERWHQPRWRDLLDRIRGRRNGLRRPGHIHAI